MNPMRTLLFAVAWVTALNATAQSNETRADTEITARVKAALAANEQTKARQIEVEAEEGVVQLDGFVDSQDAREVAAREAARVPGVLKVESNLVVRADQRTVGQAVDDTVIVAKVKSQLVNKSGFETASNVNVEVRAGVVQLSGFVSSAEQKTEAERVARSIAGVKEVRNQIQLRPES